MGRGLVFVFVNLLLVAFTAPAFACAPPDFPTPSTIAKLALIDSRRGDMSVEEENILREYQEDRDLYLELYDQAYPCPLIGGDDVKRLQALNSEEIIAKLAPLKDKWAPIAIVPPEPEEEEQVFIDIPQGEGYIME